MNPHSWKGTCSHVGGLLYACLLFFSLHWKSERPSGEASNVPFLLVIWLFCFGCKLWKNFLLSLHENNIPVAAMDVWGLEKMFHDKSGMPVNHSQAHELFPSFMWEDRGWTLGHGLWAESSLTSHFWVCGRSPSWKQTNKKMIKSFRQRIFKIFF